DSPLLPYTTLFRSRHDETHARAAILREAPEETLRPAVRARPLRRVRARVVIHLLNEATLILGRQQREVGRNLQDRAVEPRRALIALANVAAAPAGQRRLAVHGRAASRAPRRAAPRNAPSRS